MGDRTTDEELTLDSAIEVLKPLGPEMINRLAAAVTPHIEAMRAYDTGGEYCYAPLSDRHIFPALVVRELDAAGLLRADPDTSDEVFTKAQGLLSVAVQGIISDSDFTDEARPLIAALLERAERAEADDGRLLADHERSRCPAGHVRQIIEEAEQMEAERDAERAARERAEAEARRLREAIGDPDVLRSECGDPDCDRVLQRIAAAVAEGAEDRGQTDG